jgi:hypothetical protein
LQTEFSTTFVDVTPARERRNFGSSKPPAKAEEPEIDGVEESSAEPEKPEIDGEEEG